VAVFIRSIRESQGQPTTPVVSRDRESGARRDKAAAGGMIKVATLKGTEIYWGRLSFAGGFLIVILIAGFVAAAFGLNDWNTMLLHSFELLLGVFMGLLGGDLANRKDH